MADLSHDLEYGGDALEKVPRVLQDLLDGERWQEFVTLRGEHVKYERFRSFVETPPLKGLGSTLAVLKKVVQHDTKLVKALDKIDHEESAERPHGGDRRSEDAKTKMDNVQLEPPTGNARQRALRKLRIDAPDLHEQVLAGDLSPHKAMVRAGFRSPTATVRLDDMRSAARTLARRLTHEQRRALARFLIEDSND